MFQNWHRLFDRMIALRKFQEDLLLTFLTEIKPIISSYVNSFMWRL